MIRPCNHCGTDFEVGIRTRYCSESCRYSHSLIRMRKNNKTRRESGKSLTYQQSRRKSLEGYVDRFMERIKLKTPDSDITREFLEELLSCGVCCITGTNFKYENEYDCYHNPLAPSIDRIDSKKGYYKDNVQIMLSCLNKFKNDLPNEDFINLWKALVGEV